MRSFYSFFKVFFNNFCFGVFSGVFESFFSSTESVSELSVLKPENIEVLLKSGMDVNADIGGTTLLASCVVLKGNYAASIKILLEKGANPNEMHQGSWLLYYAIILNKTDVAELLLEHGAFVDSLNEEGYAPVVTALVLNKIEFVELLLKYKANPNQYHENFSLLHQAIGLGKIEAVELLLEYGADATEVHKDISLLYLAKRLGNEEIIGLIENKIESLQNIEKQQKDEIVFSLFMKHITKPDSDKESCDNDSINANKSLTSIKNHEYNFCEYNSVIPEIQNMYEANKLIGLVTFVASANEVSFSEAPLVDQLY